MQLTMNTCAIQNKVNSTSILNLLHKIIKCQIKKLSISEKIHNEFSKSS